MLNEPVPIVGFSKYLIAKEGYILNARTLKLREFGFSRNGYLMTGLHRDDGKFVSVKVHRLVAKHFVPPYGVEGLVVDHINGDRTNNSYLNLRWVTPSVNMQSSKPHYCLCLCGHNVTRVAIWQTSA